MDDKLLDLTDDQLIDVYTNYKKYNYSEKIRDEALKLLKKHKVSKDRIEKHKIINLEKDHEQKYKKQEIMDIFKNYRKYGIITIILYFITISIIIYLSFIVFYIGGAIFIMLPIILILYIFHIISINKNMEFRVKAGLEEKNKVTGAIIYYIIVFPISPIIFLYNIIYMKKEINRL